jgi:hypothetical protein
MTAEVRPAGRLGACGALVALGSALALVGTAPTAGASTGGVRVVPTTRTETSHSFAGYGLGAVSGKNHAWTLTTTITVPHLKCTAAERVVDPSVQLTATGSQSRVVLAGVYVGCVNGRPDYHPVFIIGSSVTVGTNVVRAGNVVQLTATVSDQHVQATVDDRTTKTTRSAGGGGSGEAKAPTVGVASWFTGGKRLAVPDFGSITFSRADVNTTAFGRKSGSLVEYNRVSDRGLREITTGALNSTGSGFTTTYVRP